MTKNKIIFFSSVFFIALLFALFTDHRWEDWYITYKSSKNLSAGQGLVYMPGEHVHSFTSPLGVLIPALINFITLNSSDDLVIWIFRILSAIFLGFASLNILRIVEHLKLSKWAAVFVAGMFFTNILIIDFSINGMETGILLFFWSYFIYLLIVPQEKFMFKFILAFAGLMYTRPDGFIYVLAILAGQFLFSYHINNSITTRFDFIKKFFIAGAGALLLYLPWMIFAWWYYGSPIPHTIIAKGLFKLSVPDALMNFIYFPLHIFTKENYLASLFMPAYYEFGGWHNLHFVSKVLSVIAAFYFLFIPGNRQIKALSFGTYLLHFYLLEICPYPFPWYMPVVILPAILILGSIFSNTRKDGMVEGWNVETAGKSLAGICFAFSAIIFFLGAYQLRNQQNIIEFGNRKQIGLWLKENSSANETVFLECAGYIGFYSGLKILDYPGLTSPEVVAVRKKYGRNNWSLIINELKPGWLVLRPGEVERTNSEAPGFLAENYEEAKQFDVSKNIEDNPLLFGKEYLLYDSRFTVFKRKNCSK